MGCCGCFGFLSKPQRSLSSVRGVHGRLSQEFLLPDNVEDVDSALYNGEVGSFMRGSNGVLIQHRSSKEILIHRAQSGMICREVPVKETMHVIRTEDENGNKMINEYIRECKIGAGSYGKVHCGPHCQPLPLPRCEWAKIATLECSIGLNMIFDEGFAFHKSHLLKLRVAPSETAMTDVLREVSIMKMLAHPNIVNLIEVIDDPNTDRFYMVLEYVEGKRVCEGSGPPGGIGESTARRYLRGIVSGLIYLHAHEAGIIGHQSVVGGLVVVMNIVHGDIKPDNLLVTSNGTVKICDFSVSQVFENDNDVLRRSPGTPVFTAPECCLGLTYHGKAADTWALGVTLYCMVLGQYPFLGDTLQETYDKIVKNPLFLPDAMNPELKNLLEALLCKDPKQRIVLEAVRMHPWVVGEEGPIPEYLCLCKRNSFQGVDITEA
ncbi:Serine/threonine-protein kinase grik2 [Asimina triloba]